MRPWNEIAFNVRPAFFLTAAIATVLLPFKWVLAWIMASAVHEAFHLMVVRAMGFRILAITLGGNGAVINTESMLPIQELLCALAGPLGALILILFAKQMPILSICALIQSLFNLLPFYPLDGGRALHNLMILITDEVRAVHITARINTVILILMGIVSVFLQIRFHCGIIPLCLILILFFGNRKSNYSLQTARSDSTM